MTGATPALSEWDCVPHASRRDRRKLQHRLEPFSGHSPRPGPGGAASLQQVASGGLEAPRGPWL